jgi:hypothetical protein
MMDNKSTLLYVPIGFVGSDEQALAFAIKESERLIKANVNIRDKKLPIHLALKITIIINDKLGGQNGGVGADGADAFDEGIKRLRKEGIDYVVDAWPSGPTKSMYGVLFDSGAIAAGFPAIATGDLDQFPPNLNLEKMLELWDRTRANDAILGVGSRSGHVNLSYNPENEHIRRIFEGVINLAVKECASAYGTKIKDGHRLPGDPQYRITGDMVTGVYIHNLEHKNSSEFAGKLVKIARKYGFFGFEDEYLMAITAPIFGNMATEAMTSLPNSFEPIEAKAERTKIIEKQIRAPLKALKGTDAEQPILRAMTNGRELLKRFYIPEKVEEVYEVMQQGIR